MAELRAALETRGAREIKTILNSGNVSLTSELSSTTAVESLAQETIRDIFGLETDVFVRSARYLADVVESDPFSDISIDEDTRLYVTFLSSSRAASIPGEPDLPYRSDTFDCKILERTDHEVFTTLRLSERGGTPETMTLIESIYGSNITTRNWNTVQKLLS